MSYVELQQTYAPWLTKKLPLPPPPPKPAPPAPTPEQRLVAEQLALPDPLPPTLWQQLKQFLAPVGPRWVGELSGHEQEALFEINKQREQRFAGEKELEYLKVRHKKLRELVQASEAKLQRQARLLSAYRKRWRMLRKPRGLPMAAYTKAVGE